jgi:general secretion pathway protein A
MYEKYYGFTEKPFSLTPDPKFLYKSQSHAGAFELLQYAIRRREGFVVITGDIGTGKTTLCRAVLEQIDRNTFTALVLNPFLSEEDLLKRILQDFGIVSREDVKAGRLSHVTKQELIDALQDFLLGLIPLKAGAVLIIDEAQNLPLQVLEQIRILSNLETDKEKLLQIILVGQQNLQTLLESPELRQLDQRVSIRYELKPLDVEGVGAYVAHRLTIAGGSGVTFTAKALKKVHRFSGGIPRLINLICDRALVAGFSAETDRITHQMVTKATSSLKLRPQPFGRRFAFNFRASLVAGAAVALLASALSVGAAAWLYGRYDVGTVQASSAAALPAPVPEKAGVSDVLLLPETPPLLPRPLPVDARFTILAASYPSSRENESEIRSLTHWLESSGHAVYYATVDLGKNGRWQRVLVGTYTDLRRAMSDAARLRAAAPELEARVLKNDPAPGTDR